MKFWTFVFSMIFAWELIGQSSIDFLPNDRDTNRISIFIPSVGVQSYSSSFTPDKVIFDNGNETVVDFENALLDLNDLNEHILQADIKTVELSFRASQFMVVAGHKARYVGSLQYSRELAELTTLGNAKFIGQTIDIGPKFNYTHYHEIYIGGSIELNKLQIGGKIKLLSGNEHLSTVKNQILLTTEEDRYNLSLENDIDIYSSGILQYSGINDVTTDFDPEIYNAFFDQNKGFAFDFGARWQLTDKLQITGIIQDYGSITWNKRTDHYFQKGIISYEGVDLLDYLSEDGSVSIKDSLYDLLDLERETGVAFSKNVPMTWQIGLGYKLDEKNRIDASFGRVNYDSFKISKWRLQYAHTFSKNLTLYSDLNGFGQANINIGAGIELMIGAVYFIANTSNLIGLSDLLSANYNNLNLGLGLKF